jgi:hypothetical protein
VLEVGVLGEVRALLDGRRLDLGGPRQRAAEALDRTDELAHRIGAPHWLAASAALRSEFQAVRKYGG